MPAFLKLRKRADFVRLTKSGLSLSTSSMIFQAACRFASDDNSPRIGFTATKKIGKAVTRNKCRRRLRALATKFFQEYALPNTDYVIISRYNTAYISFEILCQDFKYGMKKINNKLASETKN